MTNPFARSKTAMEKDFPKDLHDNIMRGAYTKWAKTFFLIPLILLAINLIFSGWYLWMKFIETDTASTLAMFFDGFEFNLDFFRELVATIFLYLPVEACLIFLLNLIVMGYVIRLRTKL